MVCGLAIESVACCEWVKDPWGSLGVDKRAGGSKAGVEGGEREKPARQIRSAVPMCWRSIFSRHKENNLSWGLWSRTALPGLGGSDVCIMAPWAWAVIWHYTGMTSSVSIRLLSPSPFLWLVIEKRMSSPPRSGKWEPQEETSWKVYMGPEKKYRLGGGGGGRRVRYGMEKKRDSSCVGSSLYRARSTFLCIAGEGRAGAALLTSVWPWFSLEGIPWAQGAHSQGERIV